MDVTPRVESGCPAWLVAVEPTRAGLRRAQQRLSGILLARGFTAEMRHDAELVAEEWLSNVLKAAGNEALHHLSVELRLGAVALQLVFEDDGVPFDPHQAAQPDPGIPVAERPIGGLGLHLVKHTASRCDYTRTAAGRNVLVVEIASSS